MTNPPLISTPISLGLVIGACELEDTGRGLLPHRLPRRAREQCADPQFVMAESQPAGVRLRFDTESTVVELEARRTRAGMRGMPLRPDGVYDLRIDGVLTAQAHLTGGDLILRDIATGVTETVPGPPGTIRFADLPTASKTVEIWLPHNEITELLALRSDRPVVASRARRPVWLHHGSSISHGSNADHPTGTWPVIAADQAGVELINLGMGGAMMLDPFTSRAMRDTEADVISVKIGINIVNTDLMRLRAFGPAVHGFLDTIRDGHPTTPLLVISAIHCPTHERTPGPLAPVMTDGALSFVATGDPADTATGRLTLEVIRDELAAIVEQRSATDAHLRYVDGLDLYGPDDFRDFPLADGVHPGPKAHQRMGERFSSAVLRGVVDGGPRP